MFKPATLIDRRLEKLDRIESVLAPQLDAATAQFDAQRAEQRRKTLAEQRKVIAAAEKALEVVSAEQRAAQTEFDRIDAKWRAANDRLRGAMNAAFGASARLGRTQVELRQALAPLGNAMLDAAIAALQLMRDNANVLTRQMPALSKHWFTGAIEPAGLIVHNPNMPRLAEACTEAIAELESLRYSDRAPSEIEAAASAALARCREIGGDTYRNLIGAPVEALPA